MFGNYKMLSVLDCTDALGGVSVGEFHNDNLLNVYWRFGDVRDIEILPTGTENT